MIPFTILKHKCILASFWVHVCPCKLIWFIMILFQSKPAAPVCLSVGWKNYDKAKDCYRQVYSMKGGGTHSIHVSPTQTYEGVLKKMEKVFFPGGRNGKLKLSTLLRQLGNSVGDPISSDLVRQDGSTCEFTVSAYTEYCTTQRKRIYLLTKDLTVVGTSMCDVKYSNINANFKSHYIIMTSLVFEHVDASSFLVPDMGKVY